jgi:hypothetical protein
MGRMGEKRNFLIKFVLVPILLGTIVPIYSTNQTIRYTPPPFSVHSYGTTCLRKNAITLEPLRLDFFPFSLSRSNDDLHFLHT